MLIQMFPKEIEYSNENKVNFLIFGEFFYVYTLFLNSCQT